MKFTECPICGGEMQATVKEWRSAVTVELSGNPPQLTLDHFGDLYDHDEPSIYCENDHSEEQILEHLRAA